MVIYYQQFPTYRLQQGTRNFGHKNPEKNLKITRTVINYPVIKYAYPTVSLTESNIHFLTQMKIIKLSSFDSQIIFLWITQSRLEKCLGLVLFQEIGVRQDQLDNILVAHLYTRLETRSMIVPIRTFLLLGESPPSSTWLNQETLTKIKHNF